jgi:hypothetical protein
MLEKTMFGTKSMGREKLAAVIKCGSPRLIRNARILDIERNSRQEQSSRQQAESDRF